MKIEEIKSIKIEISDSDSDHFKSAIKKLSEENKRAGFTASILNSDEKKIIDDINKELNK